MVLPAFLCALVLSASPLAYAAQSSSTNYLLDEVFFGTGGTLNACSTSYCAKQAAGEMGVGRSESTNYSSQSGFNTFRTPSLTFTVTGGSTDLGVLSTLSTSRTTATFSVKSYLAGGYVVQTVSDPPTSTSGSTHTLSNLTSPTAQAANQEQFGINLVANTTPPLFGADPAQIPDATFSFGQAAPGYNTQNLFKYVKGDTVALSTKSSGQTDYTISYIFNIGPLTPAGTYNFNHVLVATSTF
jgi:hypothetical protein